MRKSSSINVCLTVMTIVMIALAGFALTAVGAPKFIHYNGVLEQAGLPVSDGDYAITFRIYEVETGGVPVWEEAWTVTPDLVTVHNGKFHVKLGSLVELTKEVFSADDRWLGLEVATDGEMTPRTMIGSVPYAFMANTVSDRAIDSTKIALKSVKHGNIQDSAIDSLKIARKSIRKENIQDSAIDSTKVGRKSIRKENIQDSTIDSTKIARKSIRKENIQDSAIDSMKIARKSIRKENIKDGAVTTGIIEDGTILFDDFAANGATTAGSIIKWDGDSWELGADLGGGGDIGWADDGTIVRLLALGDSVGIGTATPTEKLGVDGNIHATGTISSGNSITIDGSNDMITASGGTIDFDDEVLSTDGEIVSGPTGSNIQIDGDANEIRAQSSTTGLTISSNYGWVLFDDDNVHTEGNLVSELSGNSITIKGADNTITSYSASANDLTITSATGRVSFGEDSIVTGGKATIGPGHTNSGRAAFVAGSGNQAYGDYCAVGGGGSNTAGNGGPDAQNYATVAGGFQNKARAAYSSILGGYNNEIQSEAEYSYLFGQNSTLTQPNTFMVDMDHIWFGAEAGGYEFPTTRGTEWQVLVSGKSGQLNWQDYNTGTGDITGVEARNGLTGGGTTGDVVLDVNTGTGLEISSDAVQLTLSYSGGSAYDARFVNEDQSNSVTGDMIGGGEVDAPHLLQTSKFQFKEAYLVDSMSADSALLSKGTLDDSYFALSDFDGSSIDTSAGGELKLTSGYSDGSTYDGRFVNEGQSNSVTNTMITNGTIVFADIGANGASSGQVMKYNGSLWSAADDETGSSGWADDGSSVRLQTSTDDVGIGTSSPDAKLHVANTSLTSAEAAVEVGFGTSLSSIGMKGVNVEGATATMEGSQIGVRAVASMDLTGTVGSATGYLGQTALWNAYDLLTGVYGRADGVGLFSMAGNTAYSLGGRLISKNTSAMTISGTGNYYVGGALGEVGGDITAGSNAVIAGLIGIDNTTGSNTSWAGYFEGDLYASGDVGVGKTSPAYELDVNGDIGCVTLHESSDARLKRDVSQLTEALDKIEKIRGVSFEWNEEAREVGAVPGEKQIGVIAQELEAVFPELVSSPAEGYKSVDYAKLTAVLIEAVKEQQKQIDELSGRLAETDDVRAQLAELQTLVETLLSNGSSPVVGSDDLAAQH